MKTIASVFFLITIFAINSYSQSEYCSEIKLINDKIPDEYYLGKKFRYPGSPPDYTELGIPGQSKVKLSVKDIYGKNAGNHIECDMKGGNYKIDWMVFFKNVEFTSGVYYLTMSAESTDQDKSAEMHFEGSSKMLLVK